MPSWSKLPKPEKERIASLYEGRNDLSTVAEEYGWSVDTLGRHVRGYLQAKREFSVDQAKSFDLPRMSSKRYVDYLTIESSNAIFISDLEIPDADPKMLKLAYLVGLRYGIKDLIVVGDLIATDQQALNEWVSVWAETEEVTYENALGMTYELLNSYGKHFTNIWAIQGNHDDRVSRATKGQIHLGMFLKKNTDVVYSRYNYLWLKSQRNGSDRWAYVCHPKNFKQDSSSLARAIYNPRVAPDGSKPDIVMAHTHHPGWGKSPDDMREVVPLGTMRDPKRTRYLLTTSTNMSQWGQGFAMLRNGYYTCFTPDCTDWRDVLGDLYTEDVQYDEKEKYGV